MSDIESYFVKLDEPMVSVARALADLLDKDIPDAEKKLAWGFPCWLRGGVRVASVIAHKKHCNLQLWQGAEIADQFPGRIEGTGDSLRHVKLRTPGDIDDEVRQILAAALALPPKDVR